MNPDFDNGTDTQKRMIVHEYGELAVDVLKAGDADAFNQLVNEITELSFDDSMYGVTAQRVMGYGEEYDGATRSGNFAIITLRDMGVKIEKTHPEEAKIVKAHIADYLMNS